MFLLWKQILSNSTIGLCGFWNSRFLNTLICIHIKMNICFFYLQMKILQWDMKFNLSSFIFWKLKEIQESSRGHCNQGKVRWQVVKIRWSEMPNKAKSLWDIMLKENGWKAFRTEYFIFKPGRKSFYFRRSWIWILVQNVGSFCLLNCWSEKLSLSHPYKCPCVSFIVSSNQPLLNITKCHVLFILLEVSVVEKKVLWTSYFSSNEKLTYVWIKFVSFGLIF